MSYFDTLYLLSIFLLHIYNPIHFNHMYIIFTCSFYFINFEQYNLILYYAMYFFIFHIVFYSF